MTNNLRVLKKDLKSFAKRVKDFKYTESALITFLLTGLIELTGASFNLFSAENEIQAQTKAINTSITNLKSDFRFARHENDKLLRKTNLELVKLMEQGDHVVKSPWSSWQYGINGFYNSWQGSYKGRGDKTADYKYERDKTMSKTKYEAYPHTLYGNTTELGLKQEPNASIPVSASLTPLIPKVKYANVSMAVDISELPSFTPRTVNPPEKPNIDTIVSVEAPKFNLVAESLANGDERYYDNASSGKGGGVIESVALLDGNFITERVSNNDGNAYPSGFGDHWRDYGKWTYAYEKYDVMSPFVNGVTSDAPGALVLPNDGTVFTDLYRIKTDTASNKTGFIRMVSEGNNDLATFGPAGSVTSPLFSSTMINNSKILYARKNLVDNQTNIPENKHKIKELVHLDTHVAKNIATEKTYLDKALAKLDIPTRNKVNEAWTDFAGIANAKGITNSQTFVNSGTSILEGERVAFTNSYDHFNNGNYQPYYAATVINTGNVVIHPMKVGTQELNKDSAAFVVSAESYGGYGVPQILYNSGNVDIYNKDSAVYFINPNPYERTGNTKARRDITIVNRNTSGDGNINLYGEKGIGVYIKTPNYVRQLNLDFSNKSYTSNSSDDWAPITMYGDKNIGLYIEKVGNDTSTEEGGILANTSIKRASDTGKAAVVGNFSVNIGDSSNSGNKRYQSTNTVTPNSSRVSIQNATIDKSITEGVPDTFDLNTNQDNTIEGSIGIFSNYNIDFSKTGDGTKVARNGADDNTGTTSGVQKSGHQIRIFGNTKNNIGVLTGNDADYKLGAGSVELSGANSIDNTGILVGGSIGTGGAPSHETDGTVTGDVVMIKGTATVTPTSVTGGSDRGNRAITAIGKDSNSNPNPNSVTVNAVDSDKATNSITLVADEGAQITVNDPAVGNTVISTPIKCRIKNHKFSFQK